MLATTVSLHDVEDLEGFVNATLNGSRIHFTQGERDELVLEGITIMYELAARYEPRRAGHSTDGRFSGFAACYLPKKLTDAWHRLHPDHRYVTAEDGKREWAYLRPALSIEGLSTTANGGDARDRLEARVLDQSKWTTGPTASRRSVPAVAVASADDGRGPDGEPRTEGGSDAC